MKFLSIDETKQTQKWCGQCCHTPPSYTITHVSCSSEPLRLPRCNTTTAIALSLYRRAHRTNSSFRLSLLSCSLFFVGVSFETRPSLSTFSRLCRLSSLLDSAGSLFSSAGALLSFLLLLSSPSLFCLILCLSLVSASTTPLVRRRLLHW